MASISSTGIGSGLDVTSIITQLVALEKQPLKNLELKATNVSGQISAMGDIKSQFAGLTDVATRLSTATAWAARNASSSNTSAATIAVTNEAAATSFRLDVDALAQKQSASSPALAAGGLVGAGTMSFRLGNWAAPTGSTGDAGADNTAAATSAATLANTAATALSTANSTAQTAADNLLIATNADTALTAAYPTAGTPEGDYAALYKTWVSAIGANDHLAPALATAEANAKLAVDNAYGLLTGGEQGPVDALATRAVATTASTSKGTAVAAATASTNAAAAVTAARPSFTAASGSADVSVTVLATDTVATLATKINAANAGVVATTFFDGTSDRLLLSSKDTGVAAGFRVQVSDTGDSNNTDNSGLSRFAYDPQTSAYGMGSSGISAQYGSDAKARINGLAVTSKSNTLTGNLPGVTIELKATTTTGYGTVTEAKSPVSMSISEDVTLAVKNVNDFVTAYNTLNKTLADLTKYDAGTKTASLFQADSSILGLQSVLRNMLGSISTGSSYSRLSDVGIERQLDGSLKMNTSRLSTAANNGTELQKLFTTNNSNTQTNGFAMKFAALGNGLLASTGAVSNKSKALSEALARNAKDQTKVNDRAAATEARLRKTYTALDTKMASLTALNSYVAQQVTTWNKSSS
jgi:flagellar hook-associated protein 2